VPTPAEMTGWSGDGSPGTGSLREFAIGAVTQHFTRNRARVEGRDFELPNEHQLDAMEAFQLSLGRSADFELASINFTDPDVNTGKSLFISGTGGGTCSFCHTNGGALAAAPAGQNRNFNTNVEDRDHPGRTPTQPFPKDGGFGRIDNGDGTEQIDQIADFLRAINTLQNIDVARRELSEILAIQGNPQREQDTRLQTARDDTEDAIAVLTQGNLFPVAVTRLTEAQDLIASAQATGNSDERRLLVQQAIAKLGQARSAVAT
jgi:hypothetical protein